MMINSKNAGQVTEEGKFPVCKKGMGMNPIFLCQLCRFGCIRDVVMLEVH